MLTNQMITDIKNIHNAMLSNNEERLVIYIKTLNAEDLAEELLNDDILPANDCNMSYTEMLKYFIDFCSYVEDKTTYESIINDETYDRLVERLIDMGGIQPIGSYGSSSDDVSHRFPELRGSLAKVHFIYEKDIPAKDSRKSLEGYFKNVVRQMKDAGLKPGKIEIGIDLKYDGVSHILECDTDIVEYILTRGDVNTNLGKNLTPLFYKFFPGIDYEEYGFMAVDLKSLANKLGLNLIPSILFDTHMGYGIKVETYMKTDKYEKYKKDTEIDKCNRRSAVTSICNQSAGNVSEKDNIMDYLSMQHFQISSEIPIKLRKNTLEETRWRYIGEIDDMYQYLYIENSIMVDLNDIDGICEECNKYISKLKSGAERNNIPIDGIVISILDENIVKLLGRKNDKNMFQVAFKFPAGIEKTTVEKVEFQVGPISGALTPVAKLKPIKINGNTISSVDLCNKDKLERLQIREGDEVIIKYDIIPTIFKDDTCKSSDNSLVTFPSNCPVCNEEIVNERCINPDCPAKIIGHIYNFIDKNRIKGGFGLQTIIDLVEHGYLKSIGDLFRLYKYRIDLYDLPGYGKLSVDALLDGITEARKMYPHQILGAIGIPSIGLKTMEKICRKIDVLGNLGDLESIVPMMLMVDGIGSTTVETLLKGLYSKMELIEDICSNVDIKPYEKEPVFDKYVCFTDIRDEDFEDYLITHRIGVKDTLTKDVSTLIARELNPKFPTTKYKKAKEKGIEIITLDEAKRRWLNE